MTLSASPMRHEDCGKRFYFLIKKLIRTSYLCLLLLHFLVLDLYSVHIKIILHNPKFIERMI
jgi:hypothetical protein